VKETNYGALEINELLSTLRGYDNTIGSYEQHVILAEDGTSQLSYLMAPFSFILKSFRNRLCQESV